MPRLPSTPKQQISIQLPPEQIEHIEMLAIAEGILRVEMIRRLIDKGLAVISNKKKREQNKNSYRAS